MNEELNWALLPSTGTGPWFGADERHAELQALFANVAKSRTAAGFGTLDADLELDPAAGTQLWITSRMIHVAALAAMLGDPSAAELVRHGIQCLTDGPLCDQVNGGWFAVVPNDPDQEDPWNRRKEGYAHAFVLLAASSAQQAFQALGDSDGEQAAIAVQNRVLETLMLSLWDAGYQRIVDSTDEPFAVVEPYRGINANMHFVEALLAGHDSLRGRDDERAAVLLGMAVGLLNFVLVEQAPDNGWHIPEHYDSDWNPLPDYNQDRPADPFRPYGYTVGHAFEWGRLGLHAWAALKADGAMAPDWLVENALRLIETAEDEGWHADGADGYVYTINDEAEPVVRARMHWVVCEALAAQSAVLALPDDWTGDAHERWERTAERNWDYAKRCVIERPGAWWHELDENNQPAATTWPNKPDVYHAVQALLLPDLPLTPGFAAALAGSMERSEAAADQPAYRTDPNCRCTQA